jgi:acetyl-CoA carboxylase biotin carboxyl carrier protein
MQDGHLEDIRHALKLARERGFCSVELEIDDTEFEARLEPSPLRPASLPAHREEPGSAEEDPGIKSISASLVGYYRPAQKPLEVGMQVKKGDIVAVIAALGLANDVEASVAGEVVEVLVQPNDPVEYGQPLATVRVEA